MIRLTELSRTDDQVVIRVEGHLMRATLPVLEVALAAYADQGCRVAWLEVNGVVALDPGALSAARRNFPGTLQLRWRASPRALRNLLAGCGLSVESA